MSDMNDETGLNLFDDSASAVGSFPHAMLGYEKSSVDNYVRDIENQLTTFRQLTRQLRREIVLTEKAYGNSDFTHLGAHVQDILRAAEVQAGLVTQRAEDEANRMKEEARRVAAELRASAQVEVDGLRVASEAELSQERERFTSELSTALDASKVEAASA